MPAYEDLRYNHVRARGSHNSYQRDEDIADQMVFWRLRHIELDLQTTRRGETPAQGDWFVYHRPGELKTTVTRLSDAFKLLSGFHEAIPEHEVVTVALDLKDPFDGKLHTPALLDTLINKYFPGMVYTPASFLGTNTNLQQSANKWPLLKDLRGKFIFICTSGNLDNASNVLRKYVAGGMGTKRTCFVAPEITAAATIDDDGYRNAVFFNMNVSLSDTLGPTVFNKGFVSRAYGANSETTFNGAKAAKNHLIATDNVNSDKDPWSSTHDTLGFPFQVIDGTLTGFTLEPTRNLLRVINVKSGDLYGRSDNAFFEAYPSALPAIRDQTYVYAVGVPSSNVPDKNGKVGIMARDTRNAPASYFAVLRVAAEGPPRVQVRKEYNDNTDEYKLDIRNTGGAGITANSWMFLALRLRNRGKTLEGLVSYDGRDWVSIHTETFSGPFNNIGLVYSSHDANRYVRYYQLGQAGADAFQGKNITAPLGSPAPSYQVGRELVAAK